jgi:hypothetical protein
MDKVLCSAICASLALTPIAAGRLPAQSPTAPRPIDAREEFQKLKSLAGTWKGRGPDGAVRVTFRVTSGGSALLQEMVPEGRVSDPSNGDDDPVTMIYVDGDKLTLVMYCDTGKNRPRMVGARSSDGKRIDFAMVDFGGDRKNGIMDHATFSIVDAAHHSEGWDYVTPSRQRMHAQMDLTRVP